MSAKRTLKILVLFDTAGTPPEDQDFSAELKTEEWQTEADVIRTLKKMGHDVHALGIYEEIDLLYKTVKNLQPDIVFNLTEHFGGKGHLDKAVVGLFQMMDIPYTGCGPNGLMLCRHKALSKKLLSFHRIKNPPFTVFRVGEKKPLSPRVKLPCIVKLANDDASQGISQASLVEIEEALYERVKFIHEKFGDAALVEQFIPGRELYVSILGNKRIRAFPIREVTFGNLPNGNNAFATYKTKFDKDYRKKWGIRYRFADLDQDIEEHVLNMCKRAYKILKIDGYARMDLRLTPTNQVVFIEANPNPDLCTDEDFALSAEKAGLPFEKLLQKIVNLGLNKTYK